MEELISPEWLLDGEEDGMEEGVETQASHWSFLHPIFICPGRWTTPSLAAGATEEVAPAARSNTHIGDVPVHHLCVL